MAHIEHHKYYVNLLCFNVLIKFYPLSDLPFDCSDLSDLDFVKLGVCRCMSAARSGNDFLQTYLSQGWWVESSRQQLFWGSQKPTAPR